MLLSVQYLRAFAALSVVALHTTWTRTDIGMAGVDVFFVISGFVMMHVSRPGVTPGTFLRDRLIRVLPLYWIMTAFVAVAGLGYNPDLFKSLALWPDFGLPYPPFIHPTIIPGWTLYYEMFFYTGFALAMTAAFGRRLELMTAAFAILIVAGLCVSPQSAPARTYTSPLLLEFLFGAWLHEAWRSKRIPAGWHGLAVCAAGVLLLAVQVRVTALAFSTTLLPWRPIILGVPSLLIVAGALGVEQAGLLPRLRLPLLIGNTSYSLYLTHWFTLLALQPFVKPLPLPLAFPLLLAACVAVGIVIHSLIDAPVRSVLKIVLAGPTPIAVPKVT